MVSRYVALTKLQFTAAEIAAMENKTPRAVRAGLKRAGQAPFVPARVQRPRHIQLQEQALNPAHQQERTR